MARHRKPLLALAALLALLGGAATVKSLTAQESKKPSQDEQAIRQAVAAYADAFTKGDLDKLVVHLDADAEHIDDSGKVTQGRDAITALLRNNLGGLKGSKLALDSKSVRLITPEVALEDGRATLTKP